MSNRIFLDSSILVEYMKGNQRELMDALLQNKRYGLFINQTVVSEYLFYHLAEHGQKSPRTLKENGSIPGILSSTSPLPFLQLFEWLPDGAVMLQSAADLMTKYNLLPNDALILAACKLHGIPAIASFDQDFKVPCQGENIQLLQTVADFERFVETNVQ